VEAEIARHDWGSLRNYAGRSEFLPAAVRRLCSATSAEDARFAFEAVDAATVVQGRLSQAAVAVASCLAYSLRHADAQAPAVPRILLMLSIIAAGTDEWADRDGVGPLDVSACMEHVLTGFSRYCELLESSDDVEVVLSSIDLVCMCGTDDPALREPARTALRAARLRQLTPGVVVLVENSLAELDGS